MNLKEFLKLKTFFAGAKQGLSNRQLNYLADVVISSSEMSFKLAKSSMSEEDFNKQYLSLVKSYLALLTSDTDKN